LLASCAAIAISTCSNPELTGRRCSNSGECLAGYRCRVGACVPLTPEVCDGEDNDGNGWVDEDLYRATLQVSELPYPAAGTGGAFREPPRLAWNGGRTLMAWSRRIEQGSFGRVDIEYALFDDRGQALGSVQTAASVAAQDFIAAGAAPTGFVIAYNELRRRELAVIRLVHIDSQGRASPPETASDAGLVAGRLAVAWDRQGPVVAAFHNGSLGPDCGVEFTCGPMGIYLARPGRPAELLVSMESGAVFLFALAGSPDRLAFGWTGCQSEIVDGALGPCVETTQIRIYDGDTTHAASLPAARALALAWLGSELGVAWPADQGDRTLVMFARLDGEGHLLGSPLTVSDRANRGTMVSINARPLEAALVWSTYELRPYEFFFARVDPVRGRIGREIPLGVFPFFDSSQWLYAAPVFFTGDGYSVWLGQTKLGLARVECTNGPSGIVDGG
jgi:hypothetical protein